MLEVWTAPDRWFSNPFLGVVCGGTGVCSSLTSWRVQGPGWFFLWALDLVEVEVAVPGGETSFSLGCLVSLELLPYVFDSAGSTGVVFGLTRVVVESSIASTLLEFLLLWLVRDWLSLLSLVREAHPLYSLQLFELIAYLTGLNSNPSGSLYPWVAARPPGSLTGVREVGSLH
ncbi:hypothetical protein Taro_047192, partial [Colocasia esculenta]|nr:hypothetical protein [Colocasia esculenta]